MYMHDALLFKLHALLSLAIEVSGRLGDRVRDIREWREELRTEVNISAMICKKVLGEI